MDFQKKVVDFDTFAGTCPYFEDDSPVNNGYGCGHPDQEERDTDDDGVERGCCHLFSCPICCAMDEEDLRDPTLDLDGLIADDFVGEDGEFYAGDYAAITVGDDASEDEKKAIAAYERYMNRYN